MQTESRAGSMGEKGSTPTGLKRERPPGPGVRKEGGISRLRYMANFVLDPLGFVGGRFEKYGDIYYAPTDADGLFVVKHPDHIKEVLVTHASAYRKTHTALDALSKVLGDGLLTTDGDVWKRQRRMLNPAFSKQRMAGYAALMRDEAVRSVCRWQPGDKRDISAEMVDLTLRAVAQTLFSHDVSHNSERVSGAMTALHGALGSPDVIPKWAPNPLRWRIDKAVASIESVINEMVTARRADKSASEGTADLLQMLVSAIDEEDGSGLSDKEIRDHLVTLFLAGHETTSHALTWAWYLLSDNPEAEATLHEELRSVLGGRAPNYEDLERLPYTEQVLLEAMRLYPPAYVVGRRAVEDTEIGGYFVPAQSEVIVWIYFTHRDARWFPEPDAFRPERFAPGADADRPKLAYLPFGAGPRVCIGKSFALMEAKIMLATLAQRFQLRMDDKHKVKPKPRITLTPSGGMPMRIVGR